MAEDWQVKVTLIDKDGGEVQSWTSLHPVARGPDHQEELDKINMKEAMDQSRYFGTVRALITWFPTLIILTVLGLVLDIQEGNSVSDNIKLYGAVFLLAVFTVVFFSQYLLGKYQHRSRLIAEAVQHRYLNGGSFLMGMSYHEMIGAVSRILAEKDSDGKSEERKTLDSIVTNVPPGLPLPWCRGCRMKLDGASVSLLLFFVIVLVAYGVLL